MKSLLTSLLFLVALATVAQTESYQVDGTTYDLKTEVAGSANLLWNIVDGNYRYFIQKDGAITELTNTRQGRKFNNEFRSQLVSILDVSNEEVAKVKLTLPSLRRFMNSYNASKDANYVPTAIFDNLQYRLGIHGGISNGVFYSENPDNKSQFQVLADLELYDPVVMPSHSIVLQFRQFFASSDYDYSNTQLSVNYRFRFIHRTKIEAYINTKLATYSYASGDILKITNEDLNLTDDRSGGSLEGPLALGVGAQIALGKGYLALNYYDIVSINQQSNDNTPVDFSLGYVFKL